METNTKTKLKPHQNQTKATVKQRPHSRLCEDLADILLGDLIGSVLGLVVVLELVLVWNQCGSSLVLVRCQFGFSVFAVLFQCSSNSVLGCFQCGLNVLSVSFCVCQTYKLLLRKRTLVLQIQVSLRPQRTNICVDNCLSNVFRSPYSHFAPEHCMRCTFVASPLLTKHLSKQRTNT